MKSKLMMAVCAAACMSMAAVANAQNCGCAGGGYESGSVGHCQGYTQAEAEQLWAGYCGENCWGNPDQVDLPQRSCFGCGLFGCHGGQFASNGCGSGCGGCGHGRSFGGGRCGRGCGCGIGKLFGFRGAPGLSRGYRGGGCFGWPGGCGTCGCASSCGSTTVVASTGCGGCGRCGKCRLGKLKRCLNGRIRCGGGAHGVGYTSSYQSYYVGNACGAMNRAGYGSMGSCCGTGVVSNGCGCGGSTGAVSPTPAGLTPTPAVVNENPVKPESNGDAPKLDNPAPLESKKDNKN